MAGLLAAYVAILLLGLLAPFDFHTRNGAAWLGDTGGITFPSSGIVRSPAPPTRLHDDLTTGRGLTAEVWVTSHLDRQAGPARVLSYSVGTWARNFMLGQSGRALIVRLRTSETNENGAPHFEVPDVFRAGVRRHLVVTYDFGALCAYVDGRRRACRETPRGDFATWDPTHLLALGNEIGGDRPWLGSIALVALYRDALPPETIARAHAAAQGGRPPGPATTESLVALYRFIERTGETVADSSPRPPVSLVLPSTLQTPGSFLSRHSPLLSYQAGDRYPIIDGILNVLIFIPFGLLGCLALEARGWRARHAIALVIAATGAFSLGVESLQYLLVTRSSELQDVVLNTISGAIGAALYTVNRRRPSAGVG